MKTIKVYQVEVLNGNSIDLEYALLKKDVLKLIDEINSVAGYIDKEELKDRING